MTDRQKRFCEEYLADLNATQAAIRAGYSPKTAYSMGQRLLKNVEVQKAVQQARQERAEKAGRTAQEVLEDIIAVTAQAREDGDLKTALKGLELQGRHLGMFTDKVEQKAVVEVLDKAQRDAAVRAAMLAGAGTDGRGA